MNWLKGSVRPALTYLVGGLLAYLVITSKIPAETSTAVIMMVLTYYFVKRDQEKTQP